MLPHLLHPLPSDVTQLVDSRNAADFVHLVEKNDACAKDIWISVKAQNLCDAGTGLP